MEGVPVAVRRAVVLISRHPGVLNVTSPAIAENGACLQVEATFAINLPNQWKSAGQSPYGVRNQETVRIEFPDGFPTAPVKLSLRKDFSREFPHIQPWLHNGCPVPCIYEGDLAELQQQAGMVGILNQLQDWLEKAALGRLINPEQGWEPVRRDGLPDTLVADAEELRRLVNNRGGFAYLPMRYAFRTDTGEFFGEVSGAPTPINSECIKKRVWDNRLDRKAEYTPGESLVLLAWPGKLPSGRPVQCDKYAPEDVENLGDLWKRAKLYGCSIELKQGFDQIRHSIEAFPASGPFVLVVVLMARRPVHLINNESNIEICPYRVDIHSPNLFPEGEDTSVQALAHHHAISRDLLGRMAGIAPAHADAPWTLVGAGSLGSKLAVHLARAGFGPAVVIDKGLLSPHNAARHALLPEGAAPQFLWLGSKATSLCNALTGLNQKAEPLVENITNICGSSAMAGKAWSRKTWAVVNSCASLVVRENLAATPSTTLPARVIETILYGGGRIGLVSTEGPDRNPNTGDLIAEFYALLLENEKQAAWIFDRDNGLSRRHIGEGCGSMTMAMSDGRLSLFAAGMAEYLLSKRQLGLPENSGELLVGELDPKGLGVQWRQYPLAPVIETAAYNGTRWHVRILPRAHEKMEREIKRFPGVETGGVLVGRFSEIAHTFYVADVLVAPEDSTRSSHEFVLGKEGLKKRLTDYISASNGTLYCLGTWHNHLAQTGPSPKDRSTARIVAKHGVSPSLLLIKKPAGYAALLADAMD